MDEFIKILLSLSFSGTLLLMLLFLLKPLYKSKFSKSWQYYIWIVVALRFLFPFSLNNYTMTITDYMTEKFDTIKSNNSTIGIKGNTIKNKQAELKTEIKDSAGKIEAEADLVATENTEMQTEKLSVLFFVWLTFALVLFLRKVFLYQRFIHHIQAENIEVSEIEILNLLADCEEIGHISKMIELYYNPLIGSPIMIGFLRPKIILSTKQYKNEELFYIFLHELMHYKHCDMFYKWFIQIIICIHWFNPFVYLLGKEINRACELSCDEAVISLVGDERKKAYGDVLISSLKKNSICKNSYTSVTFAKNTVQIKERLGAIMDYKKKSITTKIITTILTIAICVCFTTVGVYASNDKSVSEYSKETGKKSVNGNGDVYVYNRQGFFHNSYIIEMGWNISSKEKKVAAGQNNITLKDKSKITIYFDNSTKQYIKDKKVLTAVKEIINNLIASDSEIYPEIKEPCLYRIDYVNPSHIPDFAKKYYKENDILGFSSVFPKLDKELQNKYYKKTYNRDEIAFFACIAEYMDKDTVLFYIEKAIQDDYLAIFSLLLDELSSKDAKELAKKYAKYFYKEDDLAFFSILLDYLSKNEKQKWLEQSDKDESIAFYNIISDKL